MLRRVEHMVGVMLDAQVCILAEHRESLQAFLLLFRMQMFTETWLCSCPNLLFVGLLV